MVQPPTSPSGANPNDPRDEDDFATALAKVQTSLDELRQRHEQVMAAQEKRSELRAQYNRTQNELRRHRTQQLQSELKTIQKQLEELEIVLESQLFSWSSLKEPFWMAVRFGGLGIVIGWVLRAIAT
jgi:hypothetical protein